jgi:hypothetical protein
VIVVIGIVSMLGVVRVVRVMGARRVPAVPFVGNGFFGPVFGPRFSRAAASRKHGCQAIEQNPIPSERHAFTRPHRKPASSSADKQVTAPIFHMAEAPATMARRQRY